MRRLLMTAALSLLLAWPLGSPSAWAQGDEATATVVKKPAAKRSDSRSPSGDGSARPRPDDRGDRPGGRPDRRPARPDPPERSGSAEWRARLNDLKYGMTPTDSWRYGVIPDRDRDRDRDHDGRRPRPPRPHPQPPWPDCRPYCPDVYYYSVSDDEDEVSDLDQAPAVGPVEPERPFQSSGSFERFDPARDGGGDAGGTVPPPPAPGKKPGGPDAAELERYRKMTEAWR